MRYLRSCIATFLSLLAIDFAFAQSVQASVGGNEARLPIKVIGLSDAIQYATEHNFGVKALKKDLEVHESEIEVQRSKMLPRLGVVGGFETRPIEDKRKSDSLAYGYATFNIFNGFADQSAQRAAEVQKDISESQYRQGLNDLRLNVEGLFFKYLFKKRTLEFLSESLKLNANHQAAIKRRRASGLVSESEVLEFDLRDSYLRSEMNSITLEMAEIKLNLVRLMGPDLGMAFEPSGEIPHLHLKGSVDDYLGRTREFNEDNKRASLEVETASADLSKERSGWLPKVDLEARVGLLPLDERFTQGGSSYLGLITAKWEFFSGLETRALTSQAQAMLQKRELELKQTLLSAMAGVETAIRKIHSIQQRVDLEEQNEKRSEKLYRSTLAEFSRGVKNSSDVKNAEEGLLEARLRRASFKNEFMETKLDLERKYNIRVETEEIKEVL